MNLPILSMSEIVKFMNRVTDNFKFKETWSVILIFILMVSGSIWRRILMDYSSLVTFSLDLDHLFYSVAC